MDGAVITVRSAPPSGQRQTCLQHTHVLHGERRASQQGLRSRLSTILCVNVFFSDIY